MRLSRVFALAGLTALLAGAGGAGVRAACYEAIGCTNRDAFRETDLRKMSCEDLRRMDSAIYAENGFCFKVLSESSAACRGYTKHAEVPLNRIERANIGAIDRALRRKRC
jgi:hypothetical protein